MNEEPSENKPEIKIIDDTEDPIQLKMREGAQTSASDKEASKQDETEDPILLKIMEGPEVSVSLDLDEEGNSKLLKIMNGPEAFNPAHTKSNIPEISEILNQPEDQTVLGQNEEEEKKSTPMGWFSLIAIVFSALAVWAVFSMFEAQPEIQATVDQKQEIMEKLNKENKVVRQTLDGMKKSVSGYLAATSIETLLSHVRHPDRVRPLIEHYYQNHSFQPGEFRNFARIRSMGIENKSFVYGKVDMKDGSSRKLLIEQLENGQFKVDWESDVCYLPMDWNQYLDQRPAEALDMRVKVTPDHFYAYEFRDESRYQCYKIHTRGNDRHLFGYVEKGSRAAIDIQNLITKSLQHGGGREEPMMLRLRFPKSTSSKHSVLIEAMIAPRWTFITKPSATTP